MRYLMIQNPGTTDLSWQYEFTMPSHKMAVDYAKRIACQIDRNITLCVFEAADEALTKFIGQWDVIAEIKVSTETYARVEALVDMVEAQ